MLYVDLTSAQQRKEINNDVDVKYSLSKGQSIWVSGGGTYLLNKRYLIIVQRSSDSIVNPGLFSLFTGRADGLGELQSPRLLIRELFEELILFSNNKIIIPACEEYQNIIFETYKRISKVIGFEIENAKRIYLQSMPLKSKDVVIENNGTIWRDKLTYHKSRNNDFNVLFVLSGEIELNSLEALDGEFNYDHDNNVIMQKRNIFLYDIYNSTIQNITKNSMDQKISKVSNDLFSEHLLFLINLILNVK